MTNKSKSDVAVSITPSATMTQSPTLKQYTPLDEMERLFQRLMPQAWMPSAAWNWPIWGGLDIDQQNTRIPSVDVIDRDVEILIRVEMPGVDKKDIELSVSDHTLNIKGRLKRLGKEEKNEYFRCEISQQDFTRNMSLPTGVDTSTINASLHDGVLEIHIPKDENIKRRTVEIK
jgi:HSP20 family protein